jgi:hypothetical protein
MGKWMNTRDLSNSPSWEDIWGRFSSGLLARGVVAGKHSFYQAWVRKVFVFLKPRKWDQAERLDIEKH